MEKVRLGDIASLITKGTTPTSIGFSFCDKGTNFIKIESISEDGHFLKERFAHISEDCNEKMSRSQLKENDILFSIAGAIGRTAIVDSSILPANINQALAIIRIPEGVIDYHLLCYLLKSTSTISQTEKQKQGVAQINLSLQNIRDIEIPIFSKKQQMKALDILSKTDRLISLRKQQLAKLDELIKARFVEMFGDPMTNDKCFPLKKYGEVFDLNAGGTPSKSHPEYWVGGTIPWIGSNMCQNKYIYQNDGNYITEEGYKHSSARLFPIDTVLIALVGATIGKTALLKFETTTNQNVLGVRRIQESGYTPEFVFYYTQGLYHKFLSIGDGGFAMASKGFISELPVPIVPKEAQEVFSGSLNQINKSKAIVQQSLDKLETLKKALMQDFFG